LVEIGIMSKGLHVFAQARIMVEPPSADWRILVLSFLIFVGGSRLYVMLMIGEWGLSPVWNDRRLWVTVIPTMCIAFPAAAQYFLWSKMRLPFGATFPTLALLFAEWVNSYFYFWGWWTYPTNFVWAATLVPGAIILDVVLMLSKSYLVTAVLGGLSFGLIFYPGNWVMLAPLHQPVEFHGMVMTIADIQGYHYVRIPEYLRLVEEPLRTCRRDVISWSAFFYGFILLIWHFFRRRLERYLAKPTFTDSLDRKQDIRTAYKEKEEKAISMYREKLIVQSILLLSTAMSVAGITLLGGTTLGFAMFFSGGILAYEYCLLLKEYK